ncbi:hypothetical protein VTO42DRAFT_596 [Malbranchea cinnamomea]
MRLFKHFRFKSHDRKKHKAVNSEHNNGHSRQNLYASTYYGRPPARDYTQILPPKVLRIIFTYVCPHSTDDSLNSSEESMTEDGCMLCDMRDLAHCALVCRRWYPLAQQLLYQHVRIDAVHYCELEIELAAKRKKNSFLNHNAEPIDAPKTRLLLFMRTVRESRDLGELVLSLRMPYMTREASKSELARTVSVLPNLRYVDLPAGFYSDEASSRALKQEVMARCPDLRRMKYAHGSEGSFSQIPRAQRWANIEVLELSRLNVDPNLLRTVLAYFTRLKDLKLEDMRALEDSIFQPVPALPLFPPVERLTLQDMPQITASGLVVYVSDRQNARMLKHLSLSNTAVLPQSLHEILVRASGLQSLSITQEVHRAFPMENVPPLASRTLRLLHYEITTEDPTYGVQPVSATYYTYLMSSLLGGNLPALTDLYVRDANFPETLMLAPPPKIFGGGGGGSRQPPGLNQCLNVYSKGMDELEWNFTAYEPFAPHGRRGSVTRPVSLHGAQLSPAWGGEARRSVLVGNGFGGFLAVPADEIERPKSSGGWSLRGGRSGKGKEDLWR